MLYWGLVPWWAKEKSIGARMIDARAETLTEKPSFRSAFQRRPLPGARRRLVRMAALGRGEAAVLSWLRGAARRSAWRACGSAGATRSTGESLESCSIVTHDARPLRVAHVHDRMPVIVPRRPSPSGSTRATRHRRPRAAARALRAARPHCPGSEPTRERPRATGCRPDRTGRAVPRQHPTPHHRVSRVSPKCRPSRLESRQHPPAPAASRRGPPRCGAG